MFFLKGALGFMTGEREVAYATGAPSRLNFVCASGSEAMPESVVWL